MQKMDERIGVSRKHAENLEQQCCSMYSVKSGFVLEALIVPVQGLTLKLMRLHCSGIALLIQYQKPKNEIQKGEPTKRKLS